MKFFSQGVTYFVIITERGYKFRPKQKRRRNLLAKWGTGNGTKNGYGKWVRKTVTENRYGNGYEKWVQKWVH